MRISDWSSDVCSSDLCLVHHFEEVGSRCVALHCKARHTEHETGPFANSLLIIDEVYDALVPHSSPDKGSGYGVQLSADFMGRSEEHTSELQSLMRISYAVFCLKQKNEHHIHPPPPPLIHTQHRTLEHRRNLTSHH